MTPWQALFDPEALLALRGEERRRAGAALVLLVRYQVVAELGHRPSAHELALLAGRLHGDGVLGALLTAFRMSSPAEEVRGDDFLLAASSVVTGLGTDVEALKAPIDAALAARHSS